MVCRVASQACACKVALTVSRCRKLRDIDLSHAGLDVLPPAIAHARRLERLNLAGNLLTASDVSNAGLEDCKAVWVDLRENSKLEPADLDWAAIARMPRLEEVVVSATSAFDETAAAEREAELASLRSELPSVKVTVVR